MMRREVSLLLLRVLPVDDVVRLVASHLAAGLVQQAWRRRVKVGVGSRVRWREKTWTVARVQGREYTLTRRHNWMGGVTTAWVTGRRAFFCDA